MIFMGFDVILKCDSFLYQVLLLSFALFVLPFNPGNFGKSGGKSSISASVDPYASTVGMFKTHLTKIL